MPEREIHIYQNRTFYLVLIIFFLMMILSLTIGRDIYLDRPRNMISFSILHFSGYLFFLVMPVEAAYIYYLIENPDPAFMVVLALGTAIVAQLIDYGCGLLASRHVIQLLVKQERLDDALKYIAKYGNMIIFIFNLFPLSSPVIALAAGTIKYPLKDLLIFSTAGLIIKYAVITLFFVL